MKCRCASVENLQCGDHCDEYTQKQCRNFEDRRKMKMVRTVDCTRRRIPGEQGHCDHDAFLNSTRPTEISAECDRPDEAQQVKTIDSAFEANWVAGLYDFGEGTMGFYFFLSKDKLIIDIEYD